LVITATVVVGTGCGDGEKEVSKYVIEPWVGDGKTAILVDISHQWEARPDFVLDDYEFRYCHSQSTSRLLGNLMLHDFRYRELREGPLDYAILKQHDVLFFNVPTLKPGGRSVPDRPFSRLGDEEIADIVRFVEEGGGLFVVAEHNNAYDSSEVLNPLLAHFGVKVPAAYAREPGETEYAIGNTQILLRIRNWKEHPVSRKVRVTSWMGGAPLETEHGIAFLSDNGHADEGNYITLKPSKESNRRVDPGERTGPGIPLIAAVEKGKGRVVVIGDHNTLGVQWLGVGDNYRFAMNAFAWLSQREDEQPHIADAPQAGVKIGFDLTHTLWNIGIRKSNGFHPMFINFSRDERVAPLGLVDLDEPADVLVLTDPPEKYSASDLDILAKRLAQGQRIVLVFDPSTPQRGTAQLLAHFLPNLSISTGGSTISPAQLVSRTQPEVARLTGAALPIVAPDLSIRRDLKAAAVLPASFGGSGRNRAPRDIKGGTPFLLDVVVRGGARLADATAPDGHAVTVARRFPVKGGEIVLMPQAAMWGNDTFGTMRDEPVNDTAYGAHDLQLAFIRWLADSVPAIAPAALLAEGADAGVEDAGSPSR
jgi:hypothetical protein